MVIISLVMTIAIYYAMKRIYQRNCVFWTSPILVTPFLIIVLILVFHLSYDSYNQGTDWLTKMLQPATVAFAVPLYRYFDLLKKHAVKILSSILFGSIFSLISSLEMAKLLGLSPAIVASLAPRSVTTPIAMDIAQSLGGIPTLTAVVVTLTGITGSIIGPVIIEKLKLKNRLSNGILMGMGGHGIGTAKAFEMGSLEGTISSLAMILAGIFTAFIISLANSL